MDVNTKVLFFAMALLFAVGMAIFIVWRLLEPKQKGESRSLMASIVKPSAMMAVGIAFLGICMVFPQVFLWTFGVMAIFAVIEFLRMPASRKTAMARAVEKPDPESRWSIARLMLAVVLVLATLAGLLSIFGPK